MDPDTLLNHRDTEAQRRAERCWADRCGISLRASVPLKEEVLFSCAGSRLSTLDPRPSTLVAAEGRAVSLWFNRHGKTNGLGSGNSSLETKILFFLDSGTDPPGFNPTQFRL